MDDQRNQQDQKLPDATPRPGEVGLDVIQVGYLRGLLQAGADRIPYLDSSWVNDPKLQEALNLEAIRKIKILLGDARKENNGIAYIEDFIQLVEKSFAQNDQIRKFYSAITTLEEKERLPHPLGIGLVAIHFYHHNP